MAPSRNPSSLVSTPPHRHHQWSRISKKERRKQDKVKSPARNEANQASNPSDKLFERLRRIRQEGRVENELYCHQNAATLTAYIKEAEKFAQIIEKMSLAFLPIIKENIFDPKKWLLAAQPAQGSQVFQGAKTTKSRRKRHDKSITDNSQPTLLSSFGSTVTQLAPSEPSSQLSQVTISQYPSQATSFIGSPLSRRSSPPSAVIPSPTTDRATKSQPKKKAPSTISPYFYTDPFSAVPTPKGLSFELQPSYFGLIQERIRGNLFALVLQTILWNQTTAKAARPILFKLLCAYPTPELLATAQREDILAIICTLGLQEIRTNRIIDLAKKWIEAPPDPLRRYVKKNYSQFTSDVRLRLKDGELLSVDSKCPGWEIAHLPGVGPYALDSYRIFYRDTLWGVEEGDGVTPEWQKVVPQDKDLRAYLVWKWKQEGWDYNVETGARTRAV